MGDTNLESNFIEVVTIRYAVETQKITDSAYTGIESVVRSQVGALFISGFFLDG
ncbi:hypothetical protein D3C73_899000 [compost metagenome]